MKNVTHPVVKDVVLVGAGHAHVTVLRKFGMRPIPGVRFTLITREVHTPYSGMLPGFIAGNYSFDEAHIDTGPLARFAQARLFQDEVIGIDAANRIVICKDRPPVAYDLLSLNLGSTPNTSSVPGASEHAIPVKPIDGFIGQFEALIARALTRRGRLRIALVGAGAGGVELLLSVERRLRREIASAGFDTEGLTFVLISESPSILPSFSERFRRRFESIFAARGISIVTDARVKRVEKGKLFLDDGGSVDADEILWTTQAAPAGWLQTSGLPLDERGFLKVESSLQVEDRNEIFAAGDTISFPDRNLPKSGVYAVRAGPVLAANVRNALTGRKLRPFRPQRHALYLVSDGERCAVGTRNGVVVQGSWVWRWKDRIDRRFMDRFNRLPEMQLHKTASRSVLADKQALQEISAIAMRCGGCGAKVGATTLTRALSAIEPAVRSDVVVGLKSPDDAAVVDTGGEKLSVQTVDYFRSITDDPYVFGKIAANHSLGDIFAMGGEPQSALAIATIPYGLEAKVESELSAMIAGANEVLREAGCALVGGHTSEGAELSLGFAVNGLIARSAILRKAGMKPGDALVLTKAIGTGTLLAADMRGQAKARWVMAALAHMIHSNSKAAAILREHNVHAATDVTGFGLLGHLVEMVRASDIDVKLEIDRVPLLDGARESVAKGIFSSLQPQNIRLRRAIHDFDAASEHPLYPLLFDPQTAGGLLAAVPAVDAERCIEKLRFAGYSKAAVIGIVLPRSARLESIELGTIADEVPRRTSQSESRDQKRRQPMENTDA
jgi:selenide,water dikinase